MTCVHPTTTIFSSWAHGSGGRIEEQALHRMFVSERLRGEWFKRSGGIEYEDYLPLTIRQIFYRLVGAHEYEKTERAYERLIEHRRCEAAGMAPQLERVTEEFCIPVLSSGGFDSLTKKHEFAAKLTDQDRPTEVLDITDLDPSGAHKFLAEMEDVEAFARVLGGEVTFTRLAVTRDQISRYRLDTAPPKPTDNRAFHGETCQVEALAPDVLADILRTAITERIDQRALDRVLKRERTERRKLIRSPGRRGMRA